MTNQQIIQSKSQIMKQIVKDVEALIADVNDNSIAGIDTDPGSSNPQID